MNVFTDTLYFDCSTKAEADEVCRELERRGFSLEYDCYALGSDTGHAVISYAEDEVFGMGYDDNPNSFAFINAVCTLAELRAMPLRFNDSFPADTPQNQSKPMSKMDKLKAALKAGREITRMTAINEWGLVNLPGRIFDLKEAGWDIAETEMRTSAAGARYGVYKLNKQSDE